VAPGSWWGAGRRSGSKPRGDASKTRRATEPRHAGSRPRPTSPWTPKSRSSLLRSPLLAPRAITAGDHSLTAGLPAWAHAIAVLGAVAVGAFGRALERRLDALRIAPDLRRALLAEVPRLAEARVPRIGGGNRVELVRALNESFVWSFRVIVLVAAALALAGALCARLTIPPRPAARRKEPA